MLGKFIYFVNLMCTAIEKDNKQGLATTYLAEQIIELHLFPLFWTQSAIYFNDYGVSQNIWFSLGLNILQRNCKTKSGVIQDRLILQSEFSKDIGVTPADS